MKRATCGQEKEVFGEKRSAVPIEGGRFDPHRIVEENQDQQSYPVVQVLISEEFFWNKVKVALMALERQPIRLDLGENTQADILSCPGVALGVDLEDERLDMLPLLAQLRNQEDMAEMPILGYCSHDQSDILRAAESLGVKVVLRSSFAASLVKILHELTAGEEDSTWQEA